MGKDNRKYIENTARTLMGQLGITPGEVGIDSYTYDILANGIRTRLVSRVFQDLRHMKLETLAKIAENGFVDPAIDERNERAEWIALHNGKAHCSVNHVVFSARAGRDWLKSVHNQPPKTIIRHMAACALVAAMYDIVVREKLKIPVPA